MIRKKPIIISNTPIWPTLPPENQRGFYEVWYLKLNDPAAQRALWLRFTLLTSANGFRKVSEVWGTFFERKSNREMNKIALKQTHDIQAFESGDEIHIGDCVLGENRTFGTIQSKGHTLKWNLDFAPIPVHLQNPGPSPLRYNFVSDGLTRSGLIKNYATTTNENLAFNGNCEIDGQKYEWKNAPGMEGHLAGPRQAHSWIWGHCNSFVDNSGKPAPFVFDGLSASASVAGLIRSPVLSSFYFLYQNQEYRFNSLWSSLRARSHHSFNDWHFQADHGDLSFRGHATAEHQDFAGLTYEDTDGSLLYCSNSKLSNMTLLIYRRGKLETTLSANGTAAFEIVSRTKNPYVPLLI